MLKIEDKTLKMVPFGAKDGPNVDQDEGHWGDVETLRYKNGQRVVLARFWLPFWEPKWSKIEAISCQKKGIKKRRQKQRGPCPILVPKVTNNNNILDPKMTLFCEKSERNGIADLCTSLKRDAHF